MLALPLCMLLLVCGPATPTAAYPAAVRQPSTGAAPRTSILVTTSADTVDGNTSSLDALAAQPGADGAIALREALLATNAMTTSAPLTIGFNLPSGDQGYQNGVWVIRLGASPLPTLARGNLTIDGSTQPGGTAAAPTIALDGYDVYAAAGFSNGFTITSAHNSIRALTLMNFYDDAILLDGPEAAFNQISGCFLGTSASGGAPAAASYFGVEIRGGAHDNLVGGDSAADRNLIGALEHSGILVAGASTQRNSIANNWIGVGQGGQAALPNKVAGVMVSGASATQIGAASQGNLISGNATGIYLDGAVGTTIAANLIGMAADGKTPLGNASGGIFAVNGTRGTQIGGASPALRNVISGNGTPASPFGQGIYLSDASTAGNLIVGNYIGTNASGTGPAGNYRQGILIAGGAQNNQIGDSAPSAANVVAYNGLGGIRIDAPTNRVLGNLIGVAADGQAQLGNQANGVRVGGDGNTIGPNNTIAFNQHSGLLLLGNGTTVLSNTIEQNGRSGLCIAGSRTTIDRNQIAQNGGGAGPWPECGIHGGVVVSDTTETLITNNQITANTAAGVTVFRGRSNRILANSISDNQSSGILLVNGGNDNVSPPQISGVAESSISGRSCASCRVEVFTDTHDEGRDFVGATIAGSDGGFQLALDPNAIREPHLTATQTDSLGNTSPFAPAVDAVAPAPLPTRPPDATWDVFVPIVLR